MRIFVFIFALLFSTSLYANEYKITKVLDGDTVEIAAPFLPKELKQSLLLRMEGIDTPEIGGKAKCPLENKLAQQAKELIQNEIAKAKQVAGWKVNTAYECLSIWDVKFQTTNGTIYLRHVNSSNGYYDGMVSINCSY